MCLVKGTLYLGSYVFFSLTCGLIMKILEVYVKNHYKFKHILTILVKMSIKEFYWILSFGLEIVQLLVNV